MSEFTRRSDSKRRCIGEMFDSARLLRRSGEKNLLGILAGAVVIDSARSMPPMPAISAQNLMWERWWLMSLTSRRLHIAGSISRDTDAVRAVQAHSIVSRLVRSALQEGATLVMQAGPEPRIDESDSASPSLVFDGTIAEEALACIKEGIATPSVRGERLIFASSSEKAEESIPASRVSVWEQLRSSGAVRLGRIRPGSRSGSAMRELQARAGNLLVTLGGGAGVEHLAELYVGRRRPVIPLDARIGASRNDGTLGGEGLARLALTEPKRFFALRASGTEAARLSAVSTRSGAVDPIIVVERLTTLLDDLVPPTAFFIRLVKRDHTDFRSVESFFRDVVEPVAAAAGYRRHEVGTDETRGPFMNVEIFEELHYSPLVVADLTGLRPNCMMELGYALRGEGKVLISAKHGTETPFDPAALPWHFWRDDLEDAARRAAFEEYWRRNINRPPLIRPVVPF